VSFLPFKILKRRKITSLELVASLIFIFSRRLSLEMTGKWNNGLHTRALKFTPRASAYYSLSHLNFKFSFPRTVLHFCIFFSFPFSLHLSISCVSISLSRSLSNLEIFSRNQIRSILLAKVWTSIPSEEYDSTLIF